MTQTEWLMRIENGLSAQFKEPSGVSRPGVHWIIGLKQGDKTYKVLVKTLMADDATPETRNDQEYQARTAMEYLNAQLKNGWHPEEEREHTIYLGNPLAPSSATVASVQKKPWWRIW